MEYTRARGPLEIYTVGVVVSGKLCDRQCDRKRRDADLKRRRVYRNRVSFSTLLPRPPRMKTLIVSDDRPSRHTTVVRGRFAPLLIDYTPHTHGVITACALLQFSKTSSPPLPVSRFEPLHSITIYVRQTASWNKVRFAVRNRNLQCSVRCPRRFKRTRCQ